MKRFNFNCDISSEVSKDSTMIISKELLKNNSKEVLKNNSLWNALFPTPEEEMNNLSEEEHEIQEKIEEISDVLEKLHIFLINEDLPDEEKKQLQDKEEYYLSLLDSFNSDMKTIAVQKKAVKTYLGKDFEEMDSEEEEKVTEEFESHIPSLLLTSFASTYKKMEDINSVVDRVKKESKSYIPEECIECKCITKEKNNRKNDIPHYHFVGKEYSIWTVLRPVLCFNCAEKLELSIPEKEELLDLVPCKKGSRQLSKEIIDKIEILQEKLEKYNTFEDEKFLDDIKNTMKNEKTSNIF